LSEAILVSYLRGVAMNSVSIEGGMIATGLSSDDAHHLISEMTLDGELQVACVNAPDNVTISGSIPALNKLSLELKAQNKFCRHLETGGRAYHSRAMKEAGLVYMDLLQRYVNIRQPPKSTRVLMYSTVGCEADDAPVINDLSVRPDYWQANLENMVLFTRALKTLESAGTFHLIEIGPHSALKGPIHKTLANPSLLYTPTLVRGVDSDLSIKRLAATLYTHGHSLSWDKVNNLHEIDRNLVRDLAPYPWDYSGGLLWFESRTAIDMRNRSYPRHEMLGSRELCGNEVDWRWRNVLRLDEIPWIQDHKVEEQIIFPAAGYLAIAIEAISQILGLKGSPAKGTPFFEFQNVSFITALVLTNEANHVETELHTTISRRKLSSKTASSIFYDFSVSSWKAGKAVVHCGGGIRILDEPSGLEGSVLVKDDVGYRDWPMNPWYGKAADEGLRFGPYLQSITNLRADNARVRSETICTTQMTPPNVEGAKTKYAMHPIVIDACLQAAIISAAAGNVNMFSPYLPIFIESCRIGPAACTDSETEDAFIHVRSRKTGVSSLRADSSLRDSSGVAYIDMQGVRLSRYSGKLNIRQPHDGDLPDRQPIMRVVWKPDVIHLDATIRDRLSQYVKSSASLAQERMSRDMIQECPKLVIVVGTLLDLLGHKNPRMRVLDLTDTHDGFDPGHLWSNLLDRETSFPRCRTWTRRSLAIEDNHVADETGVENTFDVVLFVVCPASFHYMPIKKY
jgi:acyl transferase domain-containing protein